MKKNIIMQLYSPSAFLLQLNVCFVWKILIKIAVADFSLLFSHRMCIVSVQGKELVLRMSIQLQLLIYV